MRNLAATCGVCFVRVNCVVRLPVVDLVKRIRAVGVTDEKPD